VGQRRDGDRNQDHHRELGYKEISLIQGIEKQVPHMTISLSWIGYLSPFSNQVRPWPCATSNIQRSTTIIQNTHRPNPSVKSSSLTTIHVHLSLSLFVFSIFFPNAITMSSLSTSIPSHHLQHTGVNSICGCFCCCLSLPLRPRPSHILSHGCAGKVGMVINITLRKNKTNKNHNNYNNSPSSFPRCHLSSFMSYPMLSYPFIESIHQYSPCPPGSHTHFSAYSLPLFLLR